MVRDRSPIADVIGERVALRNAGGGNLKGLCPFHEEKSPSLSVSPARGLFHCFGCGVGGDVIRFIERIDHVSFSEAVERLAAEAGIELHYVDGPGASRPPGQRARLVDAHSAPRGSMPSSWPRRKGRSHARSSRSEDSMTPPLRPSAVGTLRRVGTR